MKHFTCLYYKNSYYNKISRALYKKRVAKLDDDNKKKHKTNVVLTHLAIDFSLVCMIFLILLACYVFDKDKDLWWNLLWGAVMFVLVIAWVGLSGLLTTLIEKRFPAPTLPGLRHDEIATCTQPLRTFYKVPDDYIVTKCYDSTNPSMKKKDVLLFTYKGKLRITNNFFSSPKDFGCYEFDLSEITVRNQVIDGRTVTLLASKTFQGQFGYRAKTFISKQFLEQ